MSSTTPDELLDVAREFGLGVVELEELLGVPIGQPIAEEWWPLPDDARRDLELRVRTRALASEAPTDRARRRRPELEPIAAGAQLEDVASYVAGRSSAADREEREAEAAAQALLPSTQKPPFRAKPGAGLNYRRRVRRRKGQPLPFAPHWLRDGAVSRHDVWAWLSTAWKSTDVVEAAVVQALRRSFYTNDGTFSRPAYSKRYGAIALAFVLWHLTRETLRRGSWAGAVSGVPRGELARMLPAPSPCTVVEDTVTRYLYGLREILGCGCRTQRAHDRGCKKTGPGLLDWHQPPGEVARARGLPHSIHFLTDGEQRAQGVNLYTFRGAAYVEKNTPRPPSLPRDQPPDRRSGYMTFQEDQTVSASSGVQSGTSGGAREGPAARDGLTPASAAPSTPLSGRSSGCRR